ncbi:MAG: hypothetical protein ACM34J_03945 [Ignavibacteria bacterium]
MIIFGEYYFKGNPPWRAMAVNPDTAKYTEPELENITKEYIPAIKERQEVRDSVVAARIKSPHVKVYGGSL